MIHVGARSLDILSLCTGAGGLDRWRKLGVGTLMGDKYSNVVELYDSGLSVGAIAKRHGVSRQSMWAVLKRRGCVFRPQQRFGEENHFHRGGRTFSPRVHDITEKAIARGDLVRPDACESCCAAGDIVNGRSTIEAHHPDYNKPLEVMWLCKLCHHEWHRQNLAVLLVGDLPKPGRWPKAKG